MALLTPKSSLFNVSEYQASGLPWVRSYQLTGTTPTRIDFQKVTKSITVNHASASVSQNYVLVGFTENGMANSDLNFFVLTSGQVVEFDVRVKQMFIVSSDGSLSDVSVFGALTNIDANEMPLLTGTLPNGSGGWSGVG